MNKSYKRVLLLATVTISLSMTPGTVAQEESDSSAESQSVLPANAKTTQPGPSIQLKTTSVTGSRELPKVLVIVPWKTSEALGPGERPLASLVEEALTPVDPDVFRRQLNYYTDLKEASATGKGDKQK